MDTGLAGKAAIVTGAASGIGLACARALAAEGASLVLGDLNGDGVAAAADELGAVGLQVDVSSEAGAGRLADGATERFGRLDVLVTCAGIFDSMPFDEVDLDAWDRVLAVNLTGTFLCAQAALRVMIPQRSGRIVTIASLAGQVGGLASGPAYAASKAGVVALTKSIARFAGPHGVTANSINPGVIDTPMLVGWPRESRERTLAATPLGRIGTPEEVAAIVVLLASGGASFVHGTHIDVNGGLLMD